jgi:hypothetical protein
LVESVNKGINYLTAQIEPVQTHFVTSILPTQRTTKNKYNTHHSNDVHNSLHSILRAGTVSAIVRTGEVKSMHKMETSSHLHVPLVLTQINRNSRGPQTF